MLVLMVPRYGLPTYERLLELKMRIEYAKELGGENRGLFQNLGFVFEFPAEKFDEWADLLGLLHFS